METTKKFQIRVPVDVWKFLKRDAMDKDSSMQKTIQKLIEKYKKEVEKALAKN